MAKTNVFPATVFVSDSFLVTCDPCRLPPMFVLDNKLVYLPA
jgi:hypothetical protein